MKNRLLIALVLVLALAATASVVWAAGVTPYILFHDDFEGDLSQWINVSGIGYIEAEDGNHVYHREGGSYVGATIATAGSENWTDYAFNLRLKQIDPPYFNLVFRYTDPTHHYLLENSAYAPKIALFKKIGGGYIELARVDQPTVLNTWYNYRIVLQGSSIKVYVDGDLVVNVTDSSLAAGKIGVGAYSGSIYHFDDVVVNVLVGETIWLPPISLDDWTLNENATLPIKFQLYDTTGNLICGDAQPTLQVDSQTLTPRFDSDGCYYIANFRPGAAADGLTATVYVDSVEVGVSREFDIVEAGTPNGRGRSK